MSHYSINKNNSSTSSTFNEGFFLKRFHPSFKIIILLCVFLIVFRLPVTSDSYFIFILYFVLFFLLFFICIFYDNFLKYFIEQLQKFRFLFLFSLLMQFSSSDQKSDILYEIKYFNSGYNFFLFLFLLFFYHLTKKKIVFKMTYFMILTLLFFVFPVIFWPFLKSSLYYVYKTSLLKNLFILLRILIMLMIIFIFTKYISFNEINDGLDTLLLPLKKIKIPTEIFTFMISLIFMSFPFLFQETNKILKAQISRGMDFDNKSIFKKINNLLSLLVPIFVLVFKRSLVLSDAMEIRGYVLGSPRTKVIVYKIQKKDYLFLIICFILVILSFILPIK